MVDLKKHAFVRTWLALSSLALSSLALSASAEAQSWTGRASYYGGRQRAANGEYGGALTAAHRSLPFGTRVRVTNLDNGASTVVTITDRGPFVRGRIIDVSWSAASRLGMRGAGVARVRVDTL